MKHFSRALLVGALLTSAASLSELRGETVQLPAVADTGLLELDPDFNMGGLRDVPSGTLGRQANFTRTRALYMFDIQGAVPMNAKITAATLRLTVTMVPPPNLRENSVFALHRALKNWGEGTKVGGRPGGEQASMDEATWNDRLFANESWSEPGGEEGEDYVEEPSGSASVVTQASYQFVLNAAGIEDLQTWLDQPETNFGWMLISQSEATGFTARRFGTRENNTASRQPLLTVTYTEDGGEVLQPVIREITIDRGEILIRFSAQAGISYELQSKDSLANGEWMTQLTLDPPSTDGELLVFGGVATELQRFFRIKVAGQ